VTDMYFQQNQKRLHYKGDVTRHVYGVLAEVAQYFEDYLPYGIPINF